MSGFCLEQTKLAENMTIPMILFCPMCSTAAQANAWTYGFDNPEINPFIREFENGRP